MSSNNHVSIPISQQQHNSVVEPYSVQDNDFSSYNSYRDTDQEFSPGFKGRRLLGINNAVGKSRALFFKNLGLQRRQYKTICCQAAFPLLFVIIAGIVSLATGPPPLPVTSVGSNESSRGLYDSFSIQFHEYVDTIGGDQIFGNMSYSNYPSFVINSLEEDASKLGELTKEGDRSGFLGTLPQYTFLSQGQSVSLTPSFEPRSTWDNVSLDYYQMSLDHRQCQIEDDWERCRKIRNNLVVGGVEFKQLDIDNAHYDITVGTGKSKNVDYESPEYTQLWMINLFSDALLKLVSNEEFGIPFIAVQSLPYDSSRYEISAGFAGLVSSVCLYFMSLSLLLPVYLYNMTEERSQGLVEYVSLMGVGKTFQLMSRWMFDYLIYLLVMVVLLILGLVFQLAFFLKTNPALYILLFLLWGNAQIAMSYFLSSLLTSPKTSAVIGYFMVLVNVGVSVAINMTVMETTIPNQAWMLHPPTAFLRGMLLIASGLFGIRNMQPYNSAEIWIVFAWLLGMSCILYLGAIYFENILPHGGGKTESPFFPLKFIYGPLVKKWKTSSRVSNADQEQTLLDPEESQGEQIAFNVEEDGDCCVERNRIINNRIPENTILVVQNLIKDYKEYGRVRKRALDGLFVSMRSDECFGLLGPNGAGKTTLIAILSGLLNYSSGSAQIAGFDLGEQLSQVQQVIGMCPQFDKVWDTLTVEEHILFYARIKGISWRKEKSHVRKVLEEVGLEEARRTRAGNLSGGMKRRLSIAIALSGDPKLVMLDEPTTGLDPASKRAVWDIVLQVKKRRCVMLTTHSMEEAEVVCDRIGIMSRGRLLCLGNLLHLKSKFGNGYKLTVNCNPDNVERVKSFVHHRFPDAKLETNLLGTLDFRLSGSTRLSSVFPALESNKSKVGIVDWSVTQSSLEEVFISLVSRESG